MLYAQKYTMYTIAIVVLHDLYYIVEIYYGNCDYNLLDHFYYL